MVELLFCVLVLAGIVALGMYKSPLWAWAAALAVTAVLWQSAIHGSMGLFGFGLWLAAIAFGLLAVPADPPCGADRAGLQVRARHAAQGLRYRDAGAGGRHRRL